jgi:hypothetical protein
MTRLKVTTTSVEIDGQVTLDDFHLATEHLAGAVPAGREATERARDLFYRSLVGRPGWKDELGVEFGRVLDEELGEYSPSGQPGVTARLIDAVELTLMAAQYADAARPPVCCCLAPDISCPVHD